MSFDYGTKVVKPEPTEVEQETKTGKGHVISDVYVPLPNSASSLPSDREQKDSDNVNEF